MRKFLREWLWSRTARGEYARLAGGILILTIYLRLPADRRLLLFLAKFALVVAALPLIIEPFLYFVIIPISCLIDRVRDHFDKRSGGPYCPVCKYDIRATLHFCPECGTELSWGELRS